MEILRRHIKALSLKRIEEGSIGFMTEEDADKWYNLFGDKEALEEMVKNVIAKGSIIEFEFNNGVVGSVTLIEKAPEGKSGFDDMTNFEDLLDAAHEKFKDKLNIETELISVDYEKKHAIFRAEVSIDEGDESKMQLFTAHGDSGGIGSDMIKPHFIRMAETRAIARALRWATNNAKVAVEETNEKIDKI